jgi:hypothetical protein
MGVKIFMDGVIRLSNHLIPIPTVLGSSFLQKQTAERQL